MGRTAIGKKPKKKINKYLVRGLIMIVFIYVVVSVVSLRMQIGQAQDKLDVLNEQLEQQKIENSKLDELLASDDRELIEQTARDKLGLVYPDERIYINVS